jgi:hypothetical protein
MRRWIAAARSYSISCSVTAIGPQRRADERIVAEATVELTEIDVDPQRATHARDGSTGVTLVVGLRAEQHVAAGQLRHPDQHRAAVLMDQAVHDTAWGARQTVHAVRAGQADGPRRLDFDAHLGALDQCAHCGVCSVLIDTR